MANQLKKIYVTEDLWYKIDDVIRFLKEKFNNFIIINEKRIGTILDVECIIGSKNEADTITEYKLSENISNLKENKILYIDPTILEPHFDYEDYRRF